MIKYDSKTCSKCMLDKSPDCFGVGTGTQGLNNYCKECARIKAKELYQKNKEKRKGQITVWNKEHPEKTAEYQKNWRSKQKT